MEDPDQRKALERADHRRSRKEGYDDKEPSGPAFAHKVFSPRSGLVKLSEPVLGPEPKAKNDD